MGREDDVTYKRVANEAQRLALLDRFAVAALTGLSANPANPDLASRQQTVKTVWDLAEAMLAERERRASMTGTASSVAESPAPTPVPPTT